MATAPTRLDLAIEALAAGPLVPVTIPQRPPLGFRKFDKHELEQSASRPVDKRLPVPEVGDRLLYRHHLDEDPVPAVVLAVEDRVPWPPDDPNPMLRLMTGLTLGRGPMIARSREARVEGSAGWLPLLP